MKHDKIILLVGRSGSGKTTVADILRDDYGRSILQSYTTRPKRFDRETGHEFVNNLYYQRVNPNDIVAYTYYDCNHYWATKQQVEENDIYIIDPAGIRYFRSHYFGIKQVVVVWLDCSPVMASARMKRQGRTNIEERLEQDKDIFFDPAVAAPNVIIHTESKHPAEIAKEIEEILEA